MKVLVTGGTGFVGGHLCRELVAREHDVTTLSRTPGAGELPAQVTTESGDVTDYDSIEAVFEGQDVVVNLVSLSPLYRPRGGDRMHDVVHRGGTENVVRAAEEHDVPRVVQMSGIHAAPDGPTAYLRAKGRAEEIVRTSSRDWVIFRPTVAFGEGGEFVSFVKRVAPPYVAALPGGGRTRFQLMWIGDFVPLVADAAEADRHTGETYEIGGPTAYTLAEITRLVHRAAGRPVTVLPVPMTLAGVGMTLGGYIPRFPFGRDQYRSLQLDLVVRENDVDAFGVSETDMVTFEDYLDGDSMESRE